MIFLAELADRDYLRGHILLKDVEAEGGEHQDHCWINQNHEGVISLPIPCRIRIEGTLRRYQKDNGERRWTISRIKHIQQLNGE